MKKIKFKCFAGLLPVLFCLLPLFTVLLASEGRPGPRGTKYKPVYRPVPISEEEILLNQRFRIDIQEIRVVFDYYPDSHYADCSSEVVFTMRPGQVRPQIHLDPVLRGSPLYGIRLNGEELDYSNSGDVSIVEFDDTTQQALQLQRDLAPDVSHTLEMDYRLNLPASYPRFSTEVSDLQGRGNEELFPTINTPHELARHYLTFRVHGDREFRCIGSGLVEKVNSDVQEWRLDTEREISSYSVMFALLPAEDTILEERTIEGVDVRILGFADNPSLMGMAFGNLQQYLPMLIDRMGPFPMPRGLSVLLVSDGGGMEYYGATITSLSALEHEVFHMYYGCSTVNKTYRDSWLDEAANEWFHMSMEPSFAAIDESYRSNIVSGRSSVAVGFDRRAYDEGSQILQAVALQLGGRDQMVGFLRHLHQEYSFAPFTTHDFLYYLQQYSGIDMTPRFLNWLYSDNTAQANAGALRSGTAESDKIHAEPDLTPPLHILEKYAPAAANNGE
ncbi:MAG: M1 family metallopeptidase [bacterium]|nr:M1 family metallopeptidase [bacterium]